METQKVILPFFYALFLPEFPQENESDSRPTENNENHTPNPSLKSRWKRIKSHQTTSYSFKVTKNPRIRQKYHFHLIPGFLLLLLLLI